MGKSTLFFLISDFPWRNVLPLHSCAILESPAGELKARNRCPKQLHNPVRRNNSSRWRKGFFLRTESTLPLDSVQRVGLLHGRTGFRTDSRLYGASVPLSFSQCGRLCRGAPPSPPHPSLFTFSVRSSQLTHFYVSQTVRRNYRNDAPFFVDVHEKGAAHLTVVPF